jgi:hypothetical protein
VVLVGVASQQREPSVISLANGAAEWMLVDVANYIVLKEPT